MMKFDPVYYLKQYPDVRDVGIDPGQHYEKWGWKEGRRPNAEFDTDFYLTAYPDVRKAGLDPFAHYVDFGRFEQRSPNPTFDAERYLSENPDVKRAGLDPFEHYTLYGKSEGRQAYGVSHQIGEWHPSGSVLSGGETTTMAVGEEGDHGGVVTTMAVGEEGQIGVIGSLDHVANQADAHQALLNGTDFLFY